ncbi:hypothetical protein ASPZODRAFT_27193 [Penicilliopsis zonata CBS 506.65]|uniref:WW domain-containing protein n=1 Tax=Penicilliopsis zonata CBS 506.65 TaxID=1073090 RepID=A0A1L9SBM2_9EURO|nr:hypothetical protein ASPZODRAFT_27193 [Penicilliopsis zonata CBS 506.65]OJJ44534.1 hypothetical protein ASPZODRAFT_27193 [Penicilliopsis zonata CBS 506.65]
MPSSQSPPPLPDGWKAEFDDRYQEWYFVNLHTGNSQWEAPKAPARPVSSTGPPPTGPPPSYATATGDDGNGDYNRKTGKEGGKSPRPASGSYPAQQYYDSNNNGNTKNSNDYRGDGRYAAQQQNYPYQQQQQQYTSQQQYPPQQYQYPAQQYQYPPQQVQQQQQPKKKKGMSSMGAAALGVGGGLLGGFLLTEGIEDLTHGFGGPGGGFGGGPFDGGFGGGGFGGGGFDGGFGGGGFGGF